VRRQCTSRASCCELDQPGLKWAKNKLRAAHRKARRAAVRLFRSYDSAGLVRALHRVGIQPGDAVMLHSAFEPHHGFRGTSEDAIDAFVKALGPAGHLLMVSLPYRSSSIEYLSKGKTFDVRRTPSAMGLVSEFFRRRPEVVRSLHPTHPVLAYGPKAEWFIEGHERCLYPCGPGTPFEKLLQADGKVAFLNVPLPFLTFFHYLEHMVSARLSFPLYADAPFDVPVVDREGRPSVVRTFVFAPEAIRRRRFEILEGWLRDRGLVREARIGASYVLLVNLREIATTVEEMAQRGEYFYAKETAA
jgi:aminoglycoside 3-N-acetyltransferase